MLYRPESFDDVKGHVDLKNLILSRINQNTYPQATAFIAEEGLGKTTLVKLTGLAICCESEYKPCYTCPTCKSILENVIRRNKDTENFKTFKMSVEGSKDAVKSILQEFNTNFIKKGPKVIFLEEAHEMDKSAQNALLSDLEYLPKDVYVMLATTQQLNLRKELRSRFVEYKLKRLTDRELLTVLREESERRGLNIQGGDNALKIIAPWAENKPRKALKVLEAMGKNIDVTFDMIKSYINFLDVRDIIPIISSLDGSLIIGIDTILKLDIDNNTQMSLITLLTEAIKISEGQKALKLSMEDSSLLREALSGVDSDRLIALLYDIAQAERLTKEVLVASYLRAHPRSDLIGKHCDNVIEDELSLIRSNVGESLGASSGERNSTPTMQDLLKNSKVID